MIPKIVKIPKKSGGFRLVVIQPRAFKRQWAGGDNKFYRDFVSSLHNPHLAGRPLCEYLFGIPGCQGAYANARCHAGKRYVLTMDLKSYFDSVPGNPHKYIDLVLPGHFEAFTILQDMPYSPEAWEALFPDYGLYNERYTVSPNGLRQHDLVRLLQEYVRDQGTQAAAWVRFFRQHAALYALSPTGGVLQGLSWSPVHAVFGGLRMDAAILEAAEPLGVRYTRYIDDLTLSGDSLAALKRMKEVVRQAALDSGFVVNLKKVHLWDTRYFRAHVTGYTVGEDGKWRLRRDLRRRARAFAHQAGFFLDWFASETDRIKRLADPNERRSQLGRLRRRIKAKYVWLQRCLAYVIMLLKDLEDAGVASDSDKVRKLKLLQGRLWAALRVHNLKL